MSPREQLSNELAAWITEKGFNAPYGVIEAVEKLPRGAIRTITFGVSRVSDCYMKIFSTTNIVLRDSRYGDAVLKSGEEVKEQLKEWYSWIV